MVPGGRRATLTELEIREFLAHDYARMVNAMALVCGSVPAAEDAVQEALARAWERGERGQHVSSLSAWVATVARNLLRDRFRRLRVERAARGELANRLPGAQGLARMEQRLDVARALAALPRRQREVAVFHYFLDLKVAEIAELLQIPEGTVKSTLFRARRALADALSEDPREMEVNDVGH